MPLNTVWDSVKGDVNSLTLNSVTASVASFVSVTASSVVASVANIGGTVTVGGLGILYACNPSINLSTATSAFVAAYALTAAVNVIISNSFTSAGPVSLPTVANWLGGEITVLNQCTSSVAVWPQPNDIIDTTATGAYIHLDSGKRASFFAVSATGIISAQWGATAV